MSNKKELQVAALENGTVIDHIPSDKLFTVVSLLDLQHMDSNITIGNNFESKKLGKKGIIKIAGRFFTDEEISRLSVVAPNMKLNIIRNYEVVEKERSGDAIRTERNREMQQSQMHHQQRADADVVPCRRQRTGYPEMPLLRERTTGRQHQTNLIHKP